MLFLFLLLLNTPPQSFTFEEIGVYQINSLQIQPINDHFLIVSDMDDLVVLLDSDFRIIKQYKNLGRGPKEILRPTLMGVTDQDIYINSSDGRVTVLDHDLNPRDEQPRSLPIQGWGGWILDPNRFFFLSDRGNSFGIAILENKGSEWEVVKRSFDLKSKPNLIANDRRLHAIPAYGFYCQPDITERDDYEIEVFSLRSIVHEEPNILTVLSADTTNVKERDHSFILILSALKGESAFYVLWTKLDMSIKKGTVSFLDAFSLAGEYQGRKEVPPNTHLYPVNGTDYFYLIESDSTEGTLLK